MSRPTLAPSDKARLTAIEAQLHNLVRRRRSSAGSFRDLSDVFAIPIGHGDLLVYSRTAGGLVRHPVGTNYQRLMVKETEAVGVKWEDPAEPWTAATLPTTDLRAGRMVYATGLTETLFGPNGGKRLYVYDPQPVNGAFGAGPRGWRLVHPIKFSFSLANDITVAAGATTNAIGLDFGLAPVMCDVTVRAQGCAELTASGNTEAICNIVRGPAFVGPTVRRACDFFPAASFNNARPTMVADYHELRNVGDRVAFGLQFFTSVTSTKFIGTATLASDAWTIRVEII